MNRNRKSKCVKRVITTAVCFSLTAVNALPVMAAELPAKDENVYATLEDDGSVSGIYVINEYDLKEDTKITDYGDYTDVTNLTEEKEVVKSGDKYEVDAQKGKFYYQGNLASKELPWKVSIEYYLNGEEIQADALAGKSGKLELHISVKENEKTKGDYFDNYLLQAAVTLDSEMCKNIKAEGSTMANVGSDRQILYNIMAGQEQEITITADVTDFAMSSISLQGVPMSFAIDSDMLDLSMLSDQTDELKDAVFRLDDGAAELKVGTAELADGSSLLLTAVGGLTGGTADLENGAGMLQTGAAQLEEGVKGYTEGVSSYVDGTEQYMDGVSQLSEGAGALAEGLTMLQDQLDVLKQIGSSEEIQKAEALLEKIFEKLNSVQTETAEFYELCAGTAQEISEAQQIMEEAEQTLRTQADSAEAELNAAAAALKDQTEEANAQIAGANRQISAAASSANSQIDTAIAAVQTAAESGAIDPETAGTLTANLQNAKVESGQADSVQVSVPDTEIEVSSEGSQRLAELSDSLASGEKQARDILKDAGVKIREIAEMFEDLDMSPIAGAQELVNAVDELKAGADSLNAGFEELTAQNDTLLAGGDTLKQSSGELNQGAKEVNSGLRQLQTGISALREGAAQGRAGVSALAEGAVQLEAGVSAMKEGTGEFRTEVNSIDTRIRDEIAKMIEEFNNEDYVPASFASEKNTNVEAVQFVFQTDPIAEEDETEIVEETDETGLWDKIKNLFE